MLRIEHTPSRHRGFFCCTFFLRKLQHLSPCEGTFFHVCGPFLIHIWTNGFSFPASLDHFDNSSTGDILSVFLNWENVTKNIPRLCTSQTLLKDQDPAVPVTRGRHHICCAKPHTVVFWKYIIINLTKPEMVVIFCARIFSTAIWCMLLRKQCRLRDVIWTVRWFNSE